MASACWREHLANQSKINLVRMVCSSNILHTATPSHRDEVAWNRWFLRSLHLRPLLRHPLSRWRHYPQRRVLRMFVFTVWKKLMGQKPFVIICPFGWCIFPTKYSNLISFYIWRSLDWTPCDSMKGKKFNITPVIPCCFATKDCIGDSMVKNPLWTFFLLGGVWSGCLVPGREGDDADVSWHQDQKLRKLAGMWDSRAHKTGHFGQPGNPETGFSPIGTESMQFPKVNVFPMLPTRVLLRRIRRRKWSCSTMAAMPRSWSPGLGAAWRVVNLGILFLSIEVLGTPGVFHEMTKLWYRTFHYIVNCAKHVYCIQSFKIRMVLHSFKGDWWTWGRL